MSVVRVNSLNLCSKAIESLRQQIDSNIHQQDKQFLNWLTSCLEGSQKFLLPDNGRLMDDPDVIRNADLMRIPYPVTALEYRIGDGARHGQPGELHSPHRIALCFTATSPALDDFREFLSLPERHDGEGFYVMALFSYDNGSWFPVPLLRFVGTAPKVIPADSDMADYLKETGDKLLAKKAVVTPYYILPFEAGLSGYAKIMEEDGDDAMMQALMIDTMDELNSAMAFAIAMNCANVHEEEIAAPKALNEKRVRKGKGRLYDFHILTLDLTKSSSSTSQGNGGSRKSPRQHLRRGHIRRVNEKGIWVNPTVVGSGEAVSKDYRVKPRD